MIDVEKIVIHTTPYEHADEREHVALDVNGHALLVE